MTISHFLVNLAITWSAVAAIKAGFWYRRWRPRHKASVAARRARPTRCDPMTLTSNAGLPRGTVMDIGKPRWIRAPRAGRYVVKRVVNPRFVKVTLVRQPPLWWRVNQWMKGN